MNMNHVDGYKLITKAYENHHEERMYQKWLHDDARYEMTFDAYLEKHKPYRKSTEEEKNSILEKWG